ncbi:MAG: glycosyl transferase family 2 [Segetibacter sp.]|nr:glycosyl transferase family 2 [Segetibacter sp.]
MDQVVSVIIPAYNSAKFIRETIESVLNQTWKNIEVIVVDDGSTDDTLEVVKSFEKQGVKVFTQANKGGCAARNFGFKKSTGQFIQFLDADDMISSDKLDRQLAILLSSGNYQNKTIHCRWGRFNEDPGKVSSWGPHESICRNMKPADWLISDHMSMTGCWLVHRSIIEKGGFWDETLKRNQDGEFFSRLLLYVDEVLYCDEVSVFYRSGIAGSVSQTFSRGAAESTLKAIELIESYINVLEKSKRADAAMANKYMAYAFSFYADYPDLAGRAEYKAKILGGGSVKLKGGMGLKSIEAVLGWKAALQLKKYL